MEPPSSLARPHAGRSVAGAAAGARATWCNGWPRRILVASDGSASSSAALATADALAARSGALVELATVYAPRVAPPLVADGHAHKPCEAPDRGAALELLRAVRRQRRSRPGRQSWPLRVEIGDPASVIVRVSAERRADVVVAGIGHPEPASRRWGSRLAVAAAKWLDVPLWAAAPRCEDVVRCIVLLPDGRLHSPSLRAALAAVSPNGAVHLAVGAPPVGAPALPAEDSATAFLRRACGPGFAECLKGATVTRAPLGANALAGVLLLADDIDAQLIVVPNHGGPGPVRAFLPNLAEPLLATARCSVLVVPDERGPDDPAAPRQAH